MCDPLTIGGIVLTGASTAMNYAAQSKVQNAREDAMAAERIRQQSLDKEADALNIGSQDRYKNFKGQQDERSSKLSDYFQGQEVAEPSAEAALPTSSSNITVKEEAKQRGKAKEFTDRTGAALGELRSFGDLLGDISRLQARDATTVGQIGGFKRGSSNVLGYELEAANNAGRGMGLFADLTGGLGGMAMNAGLGGPRAATAAVAPTVGGAASVPLPVPRPANLTGPSMAAGRSIYSLYG